MDAPISSPTTTQQSTGFQPPPAQIASPQPVPVKTPSTDAFLKDFTLVAEAAKRAQMAVMMREFESVGLSS